MKVTSVEHVLASVTGPEPLLSKEREEALTTRQRELLDALETLFDGDGFAQHSMADLAKRLRCSLNTLYLLAPGRDDLILMVVDRSLRRGGRAAFRAVDPDMSPLESLRTFHAASTNAISNWSPAFARDLRLVPAAQQVADGHERYLADIAKALLDAAVAEGEIAPIDTVAVALVVSQLGAIFTQSDAMSRIDGSPKQAADALLEVLLHGLRN